MREFAKRRLGCSCCEERTQERIARRWPEMFRETARMKIHKKKSESGKRLAEMLAAVFPTPWNYMIVVFVSSLIVAIFFIYGS